MSFMPAIIYKSYSLYFMLTINLFTEKKLHNEDSHNYYNDQIEEA
jgi:hypothetical protein